MENRHLRLLSGCEKAGKSLGSATWDGNSLFISHVKFRSEVLNE